MKSSISTPSPDSSPIAFYIHMGFVWVLGIVIGGCTALITRRLTLGLIVTVLVLFYGLLKYFYHESLLRRNTIFVLLLIPLTFAIYLARPRLFPSRQDFRNRYPFVEYAPHADAHPPARTSIHFSTPLMELGDVQEYAVSAYGDTYLVSINVSVLRPDANEATLRQLQALQPDFKNAVRQFLTAYDVTSLARLPLSDPHTDSVVSLAERFAKVRAPSDHQTLKQSLESVVYNAGIGSMPIFRINRFRLAKQDSGLSASGSIPRRTLQ